MEIFLELAIILGITLGISAIMRLLKQPLIIGYIAAGIIASPYFLDLMSSAETISVFSQIGVTFLLFIVGLNLSPKVIKEVGKVSLVTGIGQIVFTSAIGFLISKLLGFGTTESIYIAIALTFSSTIIIMKLLSDKQDLEKLYGKISVGFLLVQDFFAIIMLMIISSMTSGISKSITLSMKTILSGLLFLAILVLITVFILPKLSRFFAKSQEFLFLFAIGWGLGLAAIFHHTGLSMEIGALVAGIALSASPYNYEISSKMRPLRDFFIILFFILLGSQMTFGNIAGYIWPAIIFSIFILIGNPLIVLILMGSMGYRKKTSFQAGFTVAQISEFSLILISLGVAVGHLSKEILSLVTVVGIITIAGSTYLIMYSDKIYPHLSRYLSIFERKNLHETSRSNNKEYKVLLFGYNRIGYDILLSLKKKKHSYLVVDYNPDTIEELTQKGINCKYGDASDDEFLNELSLTGMKMAISTVPDFEANMLLIQRIREKNKNAIIIAISHQLDEAIKLYEQGATYVIMPHFLGGHYTSRLIEAHGLDTKKFMKERTKHISYLIDRKQLGHEHPKGEHEKYN